MKTKIDADKVLDELMKASSSCIEVFGEKEELDECITRLNRPFVQKLIKRMKF